MTGRAQVGATAGQGNGTGRSRPGRSPRPTRRRSGRGQMPGRFAGRSSGRSVVQPVNRTALVRGDVPAAVARLLPAAVAAPGLPGTPRVRAVPGTVVPVGVI